MKYNAPRLKYFFFVNKNSRVQNNKQKKNECGKKNGLFVSSCALFVLLQLCLINCYQRLNEREI